MSIEVWHIQIDNNPPPIHFNEAWSTKIHRNLKSPEALTSKLTKIRSCYFNKASIYQDIHRLGHVNWGLTHPKTQSTAHVISIRLNSPRSIAHFMSIEVWHIQIDIHRPCYFNGALSTQIHRSSSCHLRLDTSKFIASTLHVISSA
jgi:hypothetical protein